MKSLKTITGAEAVQLAKEQELPIKSSRNGCQLTIEQADRVLASGYGCKLDDLPPEIKYDRYVSKDDLTVEFECDPDCWVAVGDTYPVKDQLRSLGGRWNKERKVWQFDNPPTAEVAGVAFVASPLPKGWFIHEGVGAEAGKVFVKPLSIKDRETNAYPRKEYAVSVQTWVGQGWDDWRDCHTTCNFTLSRPLTDGEWQAILDERVAADSRRGARKALCDLIHSVGETPKEVPVQELVEKIKWPIRSQPDYLSRSATHVFLSHYNGADGDDWSYNNSGGYVVWVAERTAELDAAFDAAAATLKGDDK